MKFSVWKTWKSQGISKFQMCINPGSVVRLSVVSPTRLCVQLVQSHPEYLTWRSVEDYYNLYVPLSSTSKFLSPDVDV